MGIRRATLEDAEAIRTIYNHAVTETTVTFDLVPRTLEEQQDWLADRSGGLVAIVAEFRGLVIGFGALSYYRDRPAYRTSVEDSVYVRDGHHGNGIGKALLKELIANATSNGFHTMFARIADSKPESVKLHEGQGFELIGIEREVGRKFAKWHDVALMQKMLRTR